MKGIPLSEALEWKEELEYGKVNLIEAQCCAGKTTLAVEKIAEHYGRGKTLYLIDTVNGKNQLIKRNECGDKYKIDDTYMYYPIRYLQSYNESVEDSILVMTYAEFGSTCRNDMGFAKYYKCIICDEIHNLANFINWEKADKRIAAKDRNLRLVFDVIMNRVYSGETLVLAMTATPKKFLRMFRFKNKDGKWNDEYFPSVVKIIEPKVESQHCETSIIKRYSNIYQLLNRLPKDQRGLIYTSRITEMIKYIDILKQRGINAEGIWSKNNSDHPMNQKQYDIIDYIVKQEIIPDEIQVLFINKSSETSINIKSHLDYIVVHSEEEDVQIQARGRFRGDLEILYLYDANAETEIVLDDKWINRSLNKEDKNELCKELGFRKNGKLLKWTSIKSLLSCIGHDIEEKKSNSKRYTIIHPLKTS